MKNNLVIILILFHSYFLSAQTFEGVLTYKSKTIFHVKDEKNIKVKNPNGGKKDSINIILNDSTLFNNWEKKGKIVDSIKTVFGKNKFRKTYYKKEILEYIFDLENGKKISHTPKYECIDTTVIKIIDYNNKIKIIESDSTYVVNGLETKKLKVSLSDYYFIDIYLTESKYANLADVFLFEINNNLLFQNLYFLKEKLGFKKIIKLKFYTKLDNVDLEYLLSSTIENDVSEKDFILPKYEYCFWDVLEDKKLMRKHRKRKKLEQKNKE